MFICAPHTSPFPHSISLSPSKPLTTLDSLLHPYYHHLYFNASLPACCSVSPSPFPLLLSSLPSSFYLCPAYPLIPPVLPAFYFHHNYLCISLIASLPKCHYVSSSLPCYYYLYVILPRSQCHYIFLLCFLSYPASVGLFLFHPLTCYIYHTVNKYHNLSLSVFFSNSSTCTLWQSTVKLFKTSN